MSVTMVMVMMVAMVAAMNVPIMQACSCGIEHHQNIFCDADFVIKATIKNERMIYRKVWSGKVPVYRRFRVAIHHIFKDSKQFSRKGRKFIYTPEDTALCGVSLKNNTKYLLSGFVRDGRPMVDLCMTNVEWSTLTTRQIKGYQHKYQHACDCRVITQDAEDMQVIMPSPDHCVWQFKQDKRSCYDRYSYCKRRTEGNKSGKCKWSRTDSFKQCHGERRSWQQP